MDELIPVNTRGELFALIRLYGGCREARDAMASARVMRSIEAALAGWKPVQ